MQITFTGQETSFTKTAKGGYSTMVVSYVDERGANKSWKILSFSNPKVFDTIKNAKSGDVFEIVTRKNDKDFTEWASAELQSSGGAVPAAAPSKSPTVSQYETRDERNLRQRLIVRQSCLAQAVEYRGSNQEIEAVLETAEKFVAWVFEAPELMETLVEV